MGKTGVLLLNIGSPDSYETSDVDRYLRRFLMDKDIISAPWFVRWPLVNWGIVPRRAKFSAGNYKKIWMNEGSPLLVYSKRFAEGLQNDLGEKFIVKLGMRYSSPEISDALETFKAQGISQLIALPMYPQYAEATTGSSLKELQRQLDKMSWDVPIKTVSPFYDQDFFIAPAARIAQEATKDRNIQHYLFSFHGLPKKQIQKKTGCLARDNKCMSTEQSRTFCYRLHCFKTANKMAEKMNLSKDQWSVSFQSRLGPVEWIRPYTDDRIRELASQGIKNLAVLCPAFVADCIETLEEIGVGEKESFFAAGGESFTLVPCVNDDPEWTLGVSTFLQTTAGATS